MQTDRAFQGFEADGEFDQAQAQGIELDTTPARPARHQGAQTPHQPVGADMQKQAHLVGAGPRARGPVGGKMGLPRLDMVLGLATRAVDLLIQGARGTSLQAGDDEAGIAPQRPGLDAGDDPLDAVPACCAIIELFEPPDFLSRSLLRARRGAGLQRDDVFAQRRGRATPKM